MFTSCSRRAFLAALSLPTWAQSTKLTTVAPGVWFRRGFANTMIVEMKDYLVVVDSGMKATAEATRADCQALSPKPVKYVFITHHHFDHVDGNPVWTAAGATTLAFAGVRAELESQKQYEMPRQIIDGDSFTLDDGARRLEFHHYGWAHTRGDGFLYLPKEHVLCTGDTVVNGPYNSFMHSDPRAWPGVIAKLEKLGARHVLPGHGQPGGTELLSGQRAFIEALTAAIGQAIQQGKKIEELIEMKDGKPTVSRLVLPPACDRWAKDSFAPPSDEWPLPSPSSGRQVTHVYQKLASPSRAS
jgi:glyoxylase-like metal-dependent hydrolase (beta-lactamase superfamily II)